MLGDDEHPISFRFQIAEENPVHARVVVWAGHRASGRGNCGTLMLRVEEWRVLREILAYGSDSWVADSIVDGIATDSELVEVSS